MKSLKRHLSNFSINPRPVHRLKLNTVFRLTFILLLGGAGLTAGASLQQAQTAHKQGNDVTVSSAERLKTDAEQGDAVAQILVGYHYEMGGPGFPQNDEKAAYWHRLAAEQGHARGQYHLGWMYQEGRGVPRDDKLAVQWFRKAAEQGHVLSQVALGWMYAVGRGVPQDDRLAVKWFRKADEQRNVLGQAGPLGRMYEEGRGVPRDDRLVVELFRKADEQRNVLGQFNLGRMYEDWGVPKDDKLAVQWFRKAAEQGNARAQFNLGRIYIEGRGVPKNYVYAYMWMNIAASDGFEKAVKEQNILEKEMTPSQIKEAKELARACIRKQYKDCEV